MSRIYDWKININKNELENVDEALNKKELIVFPTETVYGIGANAFDGEACKKIFVAKGRPSDNPLIVHVSDRKMLDMCVSEVSPIEEKLINDFMPGPFTLILKKNDIIPLKVTAGLDTVAVRMPDNHIANEIIASFGKPIAAPSANQSGKPSGTRISDIEYELGDKVFALVDGGNTEIGLESTVVRVVDDVPVILRPGAVTTDDIIKSVGKVKVDEHVLNEVGENEVVLSPGMKHKHYSPKTKCVMVDIENSEKREKFFEKYEDKKICVLGMGDNYSKTQNYTYWSMGKNLNEVSKNIFSLLRKADCYDFDVVFIESVPTEGVGLAVMNRLIRTCGYNVVK